MEKYFPIELPEQFPCADSNMKSLSWDRGGLVADFFLPGGDRVLRLRFDRIHVARILDEMPLSTEDELRPDSGLVPNHFAYRVEGALFWKSQSPVLYETQPQAKHYRFITGWMCLDVIADNSPELSIEEQAD